METKKRLELALYEAMRSNQELRKRTIRLALANIKNSEIDRSSPIEDGDVLNILQKEIKSRRESIIDAQKANRSDLVEVAEAEIKIIEEFLPPLLDENSIRELVRSAISELSASKPGDMGKVIKLVMSKVQGRATGEQVSKLVRDVLQNQ